MNDVDALAEAYVQHEVLGYVARRPGACDTFKGILDWWLHEQRRHIGRTTVRHAIHHLVERGALTKRRLPGGRVLYLATEWPPQPQQQE